MPRLLLILFLVLVVLASCGGPTSATPTATPGPAPQIKLTFWHAWSDQDGRLLSELAREYNSAHPEVHIQVQRKRLDTLLQDYSAAVEDQTAPDLVLLDDNRWISAPELDQRMLPLEGRVSGELEGQLSLVLAGGRKDGQLYGIPFSYNLPVLFFHRGHMTEGPPPSTEEMLRRAEFFSRDPSVGKYGLAYNLTLDFTLPYLSGFGGRVISSGGEVVLAGEGRAGAVAWLEWLRQLRRLSLEGKLLADENKSDIEQAVQRGDADVMVVDWASARAKYEHIWGDDMVGIAPLPPLTRAAGQNPVRVDVTIHSEVLVLNPTSEAAQKQAALDFAEWLAGTEAQRRLLELPTKQPANSAVDLSAHPLNAQLRKAADDAGQQVAPSQGLEKSWPLLKQMVRRVLQNTNEPVEQEVDRTAAQICGALGRQC